MRDTLGRHGTGLLRIAAGLMAAIMLSGCIIAPVPYYRPRYYSYYAR